jgi:hypothetical protein
MNSKWEEFGSPNRIRTDNLSVNSGPREGVVNLPVCKLWPFCQRAEGWPLLRRVWLTFVCAERYLPCSSSMDQLTGLAAKATALHQSALGPVSKSLMVVPISMN